MYTASHPSPEAVKRRSVFIKKTAKSIRWEAGGKVFIWQLNKGIKFILAVHYQHREKDFSFLPPLPKGMSHTCLMWQQRAGADHLQLHHNSILTSTSTSTFTSISTSLSPPPPLPPHLHLHLFSRSCGSVLWQGQWAAFRLLLSCSVGLGLWMKSPGGAQWCLCAGLKRGS